MMLCAVVVLHLLLMIMCYDGVIVTMGSVTNIETKKDNLLSLSDSIITPILLGVVIIFLKRVIFAWLKWSPKETEQTDEELLDP